MADCALRPLHAQIHPLLDRLVRAKVRARFGGRLVAACSGGARLEPEVGRFFLALGLKIMQGYGLTLQATTIHRLLRVCQRDEGDGWAFEHGEENQNIHERHPGPRFGGVGIDDRRGAGAV